MIIEIFLNNFKKTKKEEPPAKKEEPPAKKPVSNEAKPQPKKEPVKGYI